MSAALQDAPGLHDQDLVHPFQPDQALGDPKQAVGSQSFLKILDDAGFQAGIHLGGGFVQQVDGGWLEQQARQTDALTLASAHLQAALTDQGLQTERQGGHQLIQANGFKSRGRSVAGRQTGWQPAGSRADWC